MVPSKRDLNSGRALQLAALWLACAVAGVGGQHNTLFTADIAGGDRQADWSGVIAYTSFEEPAQDAGGAPILGNGVAYFDTYERCGTGASPTSNALWDHELAAESAISPSAPVRYSTCTEGIYELGFRTFYTATAEATGELSTSPTGTTTDTTGLCDGDDIGVIGDSGTAQYASGYAGAGSAPDGGQYFIIEDTGGGLVYVALDSVDVSTYTNIAVKFYYRIGFVNYDTRDMLKVWTENAAGVETEIISAVGGGGTTNGEFETDDGEALPRGQWAEREQALPPTYGEVNMKFGLRSNTGSEEVVFDHFRVEGSGEKPPSYTYLVSNCEAINRLGCSNVPDTCGPCFEGHHAGDAFENSNVPCETCASLNRGDTGSPLARWNNYEQTICKACLEGFVAFSDLQNLQCYESAEDENLCPHHPQGGHYYIGTRVIRCMEHNAATDAPASASFENICTEAGICPTDAAMRGQTQYCHTGIRDAVNYPGVNIEDELLTVERLVNHDSPSEPLVQQTRLSDLAKTYYPGDLGWNTFWRPTASMVGQPTCVGCAKDGSQPNACHSLGATRGEDLPHKRTPHGKQYFAVGGDSDGFVFVVVDPVTVDTTRTAFMSAWVHVSGSEWEGDVGNTNRLEGVFVNVWATIELADGGVQDVYALQTEGQDIHTVNWAGVCDNLAFTTQADCEALGTCSVGDPCLEATCTARSYCSLDGYNTEEACTDVREVWTTTTWSPSPGTWTAGKNQIIEDTWMQYRVDLPATTRLVTMQFGADVPHADASVWFDNVEIAYRDVADGCTDVLADNYDPDAVKDSGACTYPSDCFSFASTLLSHIQTTHGYAGDVAVDPASDMCLLLDGVTLPFDEDRFADTSLITEPSLVDTETCTATYADLCPISLDGTEQTCLDAGDPAGCRSVVLDTNPETCTGHGTVAPDGTPQCKHTPASVDADEVCEPNTDCVYTREIAEACNPITDFYTCRNVALDGDEATCTSIGGGLKCQYTAAGVDGAPEVCEPVDDSAGCRSISLNGTPEICTGHAGGNSCQYTSPQSEACVAESLDDCPAENDSLHSPLRACNIAAQCTYTAEVVGSCDPIADSAGCRSVVLNGLEATCTNHGTGSDCLYTPANPDKGTGESCEPSADDNVLKCRTISTDAGGDLCLANVGSPPTGSSICQYTAPVAETCAATDEAVCTGQTLDGRESTCVGAGQCSYIWPIYESCEPTADDKNCRAVIPNGVEEACTMFSGGNWCTYREQVDYVRETCEPATDPAGCRGVTLDGNPDTCTNHGDGQSCEYTAAEDTIGMAAACAPVDAHGCQAAHTSAVTTAEREAACREHGEGADGEYCVYTARVDYTEEECVPSADRDNCRGATLDGNEETCTSRGTCTYTAQVLESCYATDAAACAAAELYSPEWTCAKAGTCSYTRWPVFPEGLCTPESTATTNPGTGLRSPRDVCLVSSSKNVFVQGNTNHPEINARIQIGMTYGFVLIEDDTTTKGGTLASTDYVLSPEDAPINGLVVFRYISIRNLASADSYLSPLGVRGSDGADRTQVETTVGNQETVGGGLRIGLNDGTAVIDHCIFQGNAGTRGGAILMTTGSMNTVFHIESSTFNGNTAHESGGAVRVHGARTVVTSSKFNGNSAAGALENFGGGGAVYQLSGRLQLTDSVFDSKGNSLQHGGWEAAASVAGWSLQLESVSTWTSHDTTFSPNQWPSVQSFASAPLSCAKDPCQPGEKCSLHGSSRWCEPCPPRTYGTNGLFCTACEPGYEADTAVTCALCPAGKYSTYGICLDCDVGKYSSADRKFCLVCPSGQYTDGAGCLSCDAGNEPMAPPAEGVSPIGCTPCSLIGEHKYNTDGLQCVDVPHGYTVDDNHVTYTPCPERQYGLGGLCWTCPDGSYPDITCIPATTAECKGVILNNDDAALCVGATGGRCVHTPADGDTPESCDPLDTHIEACAAVADGKAETCLDALVGGVSVCTTVPAVACRKCPNLQAGRDGACDTCPDGSRVKDEVCMDESDQCKLLAPAGQWNSCNGYCVPNREKVDCEICPEGWVGTESTCTKCPVGTLPDFPNTVEPPVWNVATLSWMPVLPARTQCIDCPQYMYSPQGNECFWCSAGQIVNTDRTGCDDCPPGRYGLVDDIIKESCAETAQGGFSVPEDARACADVVLGLPSSEADCLAVMTASVHDDAALTACTYTPQGETFFSGTLTAYTSHPNVLQYGGHGTECADCLPGEQPQRGAIVDHLMPASTHCVSCETLGVGMYNTDGRECILCENGKVPNVEYVAEACTEAADVGVAEDANACANVVLGTASSEADCLAVMTSSTDDSPQLGACEYTAEVRKRTICTQCEPGFISNFGEPCAVCPDGKQPNAASTTCLDCPQFQAGIGGFCAKCPDGTRVKYGECDDATDACSELAPADKFKSCNGYCVPRTDAAPSTMCEICPEGWVGTDSTCAPCPIGKLPNYPNTVEPPVWDVDSHEWVPVFPARTSCLDCPPYMYSPEGKECFWCSAGEIVNILRTGCEDCPRGRYGLVDDRVYGETYFSGALPIAVHPNVLTYGGHGTVCADCLPGEQPQRGTVVNHLVTGATWCQSCETLGVGMYSAIGIECILCPDNSYPNDDRTGCIQCAPGFISNRGEPCEVCPDGKQPNAAVQEACTEAADVGVAEDADACANVVLGTASSEADCLAVMTSSTDDSPQLGACEYTAEVREQTFCEDCPDFHAGRDGFCDRCPDGTRVLDNGDDLTDCEICPEGWVGTDSVCTKCPVGTLPNFPNAVEPPVWDVSDHIWIAQVPARTECLDCPQYMYSPQGNECFWCGPGEIVNSARSGCEECAVGQYGLIDDRPGESYFSEALDPYIHPNVLTYSGHGIECASCLPGEQPQRGIIVDHTVAAATRCLACETLGVGMYSPDGLECILCRDNTYANEHPIPESCTEAAEVSVADDAAACAAVVLGAEPSEADCMSVMTASDADDPTDNACVYTAPARKRTFCIQCAPGFISNRGEPCEVCPDGKHPNAAVQEACTEAADVGVAEDADACANVVLGTASSEADCLAVMTSSTDDSPQLGACEYTAEVREQTFCEDCPDFHAGRDGFCDRCPDGTRVLDNGDDLTDCEICPEGWVGTDSVCWPCVAGQVPNFPNAVEPPVWDVSDHIWIAQVPARTECLDCPQYMYSPQGNECFWCGPGEIVNSARSGCEECAVGQYGLIDDRPGESYFSEALDPYIHPNVLTYSGHGIECASCLPGEQPQRGIIVDHTVAAATRCLACETLGVGMYSPDGLECILCEDGKEPNEHPIPESCTEAAEVSVADDAAACAAVVLGAEPSEADCMSVMTASDADDAIPPVSATAPADSEGFGEYTLTVVVDEAYSVHDTVQITSASSGCGLVGTYTVASISGTSLTFNEAFTANAGNIADCRLERAAKRACTYTAAIRARSICTKCPVGYAGTKGECEICPPGMYPDIDHTIIQLGGSGRACRWQTEDDNLNTYYSMPSDLQAVAPLDDDSSCRRACMGDTDCHGFEYNTDTGRCELWNRMPLATSASTSGYKCYQKVPNELDTLCSQCNSTSYSIIGICINCGDGTLPNVDQTGCDSCAVGEAGTFGECSMCTPGKFVKPDHTECITCEPGKYSTDGLVCEYCVGDGLYTPLAGISCVPCAAGKYNNPQHSGCLDCSGGQYGELGICYTCPDGKLPNSDHTGCESCPDTHWGLRGSCEICPDGKQPNIAVEESCVEAADVSVPADATACATVVLGHPTSPADTRSSEAECNAVMTAATDDPPTLAACKYTAEVTRTFCIDCLFGFAGQQGTCAKCPPSQYPNAYIRATQCLDCGFGQYSSDGNECHWCQAGYRPNPTRTGCIGCLEGWFSNDIQNATHTGVYCRRCAPGKEPNARLFADGCNDCFSNEYSPGNGSFCETCGNGEQPNDEQTSCQLCPTGYAGETGRCSLCPPGRTPDILQIECLTCHEKHDATYFGIDGTCSQCPDGTEPNVEQIGCQACAFGYTGTGGACYRCDMGTEPNSNRTQCIQCPDNRVSLEGYECELCPPGKFARDDNRACMNCPPGTYKIDMENVTCSVCPVGHQPSNRMRSGSVGCDLCPIDTFSLEGLECYPCSTWVPDGQQGQLGQFSAGVVSTPQKSVVERTSCECINGTEYKNDRQLAGDEWLDLGPMTAKCNDIDECIDLDPCDILVDCVNIPRVLPYDDGYYCTECPDGFVGDGVKAHGGCFPEQVNTHGGEEPLEPTFPMELTAVGVGNIGGDTKPPSHAQLDYRDKLSAGIAAKVGVKASLIDISTFTAVPLAAAVSGAVNTGAAGRRLNEDTSFTKDSALAVFDHVLDRRRLQHEIPSAAPDTTLAVGDDTPDRRNLQTADDWQVSFEFALKGDAPQILHSLENAFNGFQGVEIMVDGVSTRMAFPTRQEYVNGVIQEVEYSFYNEVFLEMKCPPITFKDVNGSCFRCPPGTMVNDDQTGCDACSLFPGKYSPDGSPCVSCGPGSEPNDDVTDCNGCPQNYYSGDGILCRRCPAYQVTRLLPMQTSSDACVCERNMYNQTLQSPKLGCYKWNNVQIAMASEDASGPCRRCPEDEDGQLFQCVSCDHGFNSSALLLPGYWRTEEKSPYIFQCEFGVDACVGQWAGLDENSMPIWAHGGCGTGYEGITCGSCAEDYRRLKKGCEICPAAPIFYFGISGAGFVLACMLVIRRSNAALASPSIAQSLRSGSTGTELIITSVRTLLSFVTVQSYIGEIDNAWPGIHETMFWVYGATGEVSNLIEFMRCVPSINPFRIFFDGDLPFVLLKAIMAILLPIIVIVGVCMFYTLPHFLRYVKFQCCKMLRKSRIEAYQVDQNYTGPPRKGCQAFADDVIAASVVLFYVIHPAVIRATLSLFPCQHLEGDLSVLLVDTGVPCGDEKHSGVKTTFGIPSLVFLVVVIPSVCAWRLRKIKRADELREPRVARRYAWLFRGYGHDSCNWELAVSARKFGVCFCVVCLSSYGPEVQSLGCMTVVLLALVVHLKRRPFTEGVQDHLEMLSLTVSMLTIFAGVAFRQTSHNKVGIEVDGSIYTMVTLVVVVMNVAVGVWVVKIYLKRKWMERLAVKRKQPSPGQDPNDIKALAENHHADLIQRFLQKARSLEDSTLTLDTLRHQLHHVLLLLPEHAPEMGALLRLAERLGAQVTDTRLRVLEVQRRHRNALVPDGRVKKAVELEQKKLQLQGLESAALDTQANTKQLVLQNGNGPNSSPSTPPDQEPLNGTNGKKQKGLLALRDKPSLARAAPASVTSSAVASSRPHKLEPLRPPSAGSVSQPNAVLQGQFKAAALMNEERARTPGTPMQKERPGSRADTPGSPTLNGPREGRKTGLF